MIFGVLNHQKIFTPIACTFANLTCILYTVTTLPWKSKKSFLTALLPAALRAAQRADIYSEADFEVFRPAGATRCTDRVKFDVEEGPPPRQISPQSVQR